MSPAFTWPLELGPAVFNVNLFGKCHVLDSRIDQEYRRSEPVNSEDGAPMVRRLSNMPLAEMLETHHKMGPRGGLGPVPELGYQLGSVSIRKVHFRDQGMIRQIEEKVVNKLRQVT